MLKAANRLKKDRDFRRVLEIGHKKLYGPLLIFTAPAETEGARFGIVVSKKVSKLAVRRNKIRRELAHLLRPLAETAPLRDTVLVVVRSTEFSEYQQALNQWQKTASLS